VCGVLSLACSKGDPPAGGEGDGDGGSPGAGGSSTGGKGAGGKGAGGAGTGGATAAGGAGGVSDRGGAGGEAAGGTDAGADARAPADAVADAALVLDDPKTWPGGAFNKAFIIECPPGAPREACCLHYCTCMAANCMRQTPADCMAACVSPAGVARWDLRCRVYNCFESLNPLATKDHQAHCEHAGVVTGTQRTRGAGDTEGKCHRAGEPDEP
jgi:hypothetical protein